MCSFSSSDLGVDGVQGLVGVGALAQQHDAFHHVVVIDDLAVVAVDRLADLAQPDLRPLRHRGDVPHADGRAVLRLQHRGFDVVRLSSTSPTARTLICCSPASTKLPPAFTLLLASCCSTWPMLSP